MKPIDKKDQPKLFALIGMAVLAFGFGVYQFTTSATAQPVAPKASPSPEATTAQGNPAAEEGGMWKPDGQGTVPTGGRDPFMPEGLAAPQPSPTPVAPPKPTPEPKGPAMPPIAPANPNGGGVTIPPPGGGSGGMEVGPIKLIQTTPSPAPTPVPAPKLDLSGVIVAEDDNRSKAIFKTSDKTNRILSIGDSAGNGWRIAGIQEGKVEIIDPKTGRRATVELE